MKDKIIIFIIGLLSGTIISTTSFYFYTVASNKNSCNNQTFEMPNQRQQNNDREMNRNGVPPEIPSNNQTTNS